MKKILILFLVICFSCQPEYPKQFSEPALLEMIISEDGEKQTFGEILYHNKGKKILLNFWASWCKDCIYD